ncbi:MAG: hypothetical protein ABIJ03_00430 [Patescibacteria group bacterium]
MFQEKEIHEKQVVNEAQAKILSCLDVIKPLILNKIDWVYCTDEGKEELASDKGLLLVWLEFLMAQLQQDLEMKRAEHLVSLTSCFLEIVASDDITGSRQGSIMMPMSDHIQSAYGRQHYSSFPIGSRKVDTNSILTQAELNNIFAILDDERIMVVQKADELLSDCLKNIKPWIYIAETFCDFDSFTSFCDRFREANQQPSQLDKQIFVKILLTEDIGCIYSFSLSNRISFARSIYQHHGVNQVVTPVAKSEMWRAALCQRHQPHIWTDEELSIEEERAELSDFIKRCLRSISHEDVRLKIENFLVQARSQREYSPDKFLLWLLSEQTDLETWQRGLLYKQLIRVRKYDQLDENQRKEYLADLLKRHTESFQDLFTSPQLGSPDVFFTRSGISATGTALMMASATMENQRLVSIKVHQTPGWYYENPPPSNWQESSPEEADILLINLEPSGPLWNMSAQEFFVHQQVAIRKFVLKVARNPEQQYFMIVDKTSDLLNQKHLPIGALPPNLTILESASLSKHQGGGKSYFFGVLACWGNRVEDAEMKKFIVDAMGELTPDSVFALHRISQREIARQLDHYKRLSEVMMNTLDKYQAGLSYDQKWRWQAYSYFGYLLPPKGVVANYLSGNHFRQDYIDGQRISNAINAFLSIDDKCINNFEKGDSFGLNSTRFTLFSTFPHSGKSKPIKTARIGFGRKTSVEDMQLFANFFCSRIVEK